MNDTIPLPNLPHWAFVDKHDLAPSEVRTDIKRYGESYAAAVSAERDARIKVLEDALLKVARMAEALKRECSMDPESPQAIRNAQYMNISYAARAALGDKK